MLPTSRSTHAKDIAGKIRFFVPLTALTLLAATSARSQPPGLQVSVQVDQKRILPFEPLSFVVEAKNASDQTQSYQSDGQHGILARSNPQEDWKLSLVYDIDSFEINHGMQPVTLEPQQSQYLPFPWTYKKFSEPGTYDVKGWFGVEHDVIKSASVQIEVQQPTSDEDLAAFKELQQNKLYLYFHPDSTAHIVSRWGIGAEQENPFTVRTELEEFARAYPHSAYSTWAKLAALSVQQTLIKRGLTNASEAKGNPEMEAIDRKAVGETTYAALASLAQNSDENLRAVQHSLEKLAQENEATNPRLAAYAWYEAGTTSGLVADTNAAAQDLDKADEVGKSEFIFLRTDHARQLYHLAPKTHDLEAVSVQNK